MSSAVVSARTAGLDTMRSGFTPSFASRSPIRGASRLPRPFNGRFLSGSAGSSRLDLAWRTRNSVFIVHHRYAGMDYGREEPTARPRLAAGRGGLRVLSGESGEGGKAFAKA